MVKVKFCGIKREEDLLKAVELNVDYVGFILYPKSPRFVELERLKELTKLAKGVTKVGVFVNPQYEEVKRSLDLGIDLVQLHGEESFEFAKRIGMNRVIKAFRVKDDIDINHEWFNVYAVLLDTFSEKGYGGTGETFSWSVAQKVVNKGFRVFLSGGLRPENVREAIKQVRPYAVDVSSGIETLAGVKDHKKMEVFMYEAKNALKD